MDKNDKKLKIRLEIFVLIIAIGTIVIIGIVLFILHEKDLKERILQERNNTYEKLFNNDNYDDHCDGDKGCIKCKRIEKCVDCMGECYNRFGNGGDNAKKCNQECYKKKYGSIPLIDFGIKIKRND